MIVQYRTVRSADQTGRNWCRYLVREKERQAGAVSKQTENAKALKKLHLLESTYKERRVELQRKLSALETSIIEVQRQKKLHISFNDSSRRFIKLITKIY